MTTTARLEDTLDAATQLGPVIREHADRAEQERHLPDEVVDALIDAGVFRFYVPQSLGGLEGDPISFYRLVEGLSAVDGSTGWCTFIGNSANVLAEFLSDDAATQIFSDPRAITAGGVWPFQPAPVENGGFRVTGRWPYASGCHHATYLGGGITVVEDGEPRQGPGGAPELRVVVVPRDDVEILDTWHVMGLAATGSHDIAIHDKFVPEGFTAPLVPGAPKGSHFQGSLYRTPFVSLFAQPVAAVGLGIVQGAIDHALDVAQSKVPAMSQSTLRERPTFQIQIADAIATAASARAWLYQELGETWEAAQQDRDIPLEQRNIMNLAAAHATKSARAAMETTWLASGASANYSDSPLARAMRDIHAVSQHVATAPQQFHNAGGGLVGLPPPNPILLL